MTNERADAITRELLAIRDVRVAEPWLATALEFNITSALAMAMHFTDSPLDALAEALRSDTCTETGGYDSQPQWIADIAAGGLVRAGPRAIPCSTRSADGRKARLSREGHTRSQQSAHPHARPSTHSKRRSTTRCSRCLGPRRLRWRDCATATRNTAQSCHVISRVRSWDGASRGSLVRADSRANRSQRSQRVLQRACMTRVLWCARRRQMRSRLRGATRRPLVAPSRAL